MTLFLYALGSVIYDVFTIWLAMLGVLLAWDLVESKMRRSRMDSFRSTGAAAAYFTALAVLAGFISNDIVAPALGAGINYFFAG